MREGWKETLRRWLRENVADTRNPEGPDGRVYTAPFARVWDALLAEIRRRPRWELAHKDEEMGMLTARCRSLVFRFVDDLTAWVGLDENGMTRVEVRSESRRGRGDFGVNRRRVRSLLEAVDRAVGPETRVREPRRAEGRREVRRRASSPGRNAGAPPPPSGR